MSSRRTGQIIPRGERKWLVRVYLGRDGNGKRRFHNKTIHGPKREAERYYRQKATERDQGTYVRPERITLGAFMDRWLDTVAAKRVRARVLRDYRWYFDAYAREALGGRLLESLRTEDFDALYTKMLGPGGGRRGRGVGSATVRLTHAVLRMGLDHAVQRGQLARNPAVGAVLPKRRRVRERIVLTEAEARRFARMAAAREDVYGVYLRTLLVTALRPSEARALRWCDLDLKAGVARVVATVEDGPGGAWTLEDPKTEASSGTVPLPDPLPDELRAHRARQARERLALGIGQDPEAFVFGQPDGEPLSLKRIERVCRATAQAAEIPRPLSPYDLRHTCATRLGEAGAHPKTVQEILRHKSAQTTLDTYTHAFPGAAQEATRAFGKAVLG